MQRTVTTTHLEITSREQMRGAYESRDKFRLCRSEVPCPDVNRFLYATVGADWLWLERLSWSYPDWLARLDRPEVEVWIAYVAGTPAGYFELELQKSKNVEIAYFGLLPTFIGKGIGGALLTEAISRAWDMGADRVWLHTCTLDHPKALRNYQDRGFEIFKTEQEIEELPDESLKLWPDDRENPKSPLR